MSDISPDEGLLGQAQQIQQQLLDQRKKYHRRW